MKPCGTCEQQNPDDASYCLQCGSPLAAQEVPVPTPLDETQLWRDFIGPNADRYLEQFRKFSAGSQPRFALTWHWPTFLFDPFLWFLYRKMYLYALIYAVGPVVSAYLTGDFTVGIVWRIMAGVSANYLYYWHVKDHLARVREKAARDQTSIGSLLKDLGGIQPYVIWLGVLLHLLLLTLVVGLILEGPPEELKPLGRPAQPAPQRYF